MVNSEKQNLKINQDDQADKDTIEYLPDKDADTREEDRDKLIEEVTAENKKLKDQFLRLAAEFDNYKKRVDRDNAAFLLNANADLIVQLLPILDDVGRMLTASESGTDCAALLEAIKLVQRNFMKTLYADGLKPMECIGEEFDPLKHDALLHLKVEGKETNIVIEEHKKGYEYKGKILRHAQVIVSK